MAELLDATMTDVAPAPAVPDPAARAAEASHLRRAALTRAKGGNLGTADLRDIVAMLKKCTELDGGVVREEYDDLPKRDVPEVEARPPPKDYPHYRGKAPNVSGRGTGDGDGKERKTDYHILGVATPCFATGGRPGGESCRWCQSIMDRGEDSPHWKWRTDVQKFCECNRPYQDGLGRLGLSRDEADALSNELAGGGRAPEVLAAPAPLAPPAPPAPPAPRASEFCGYAIFHGKVLRERPELRGQPVEYVNGVIQRAWYELPPQQRDRYNDAAAIIESRRADP